MDHNRQELKRVLTVKHLVFFGLAFMSPMVFFLTYGVVVQLSHGMLPTGYAIAVLVMLFTAYSYSQMVKVYPLSGSAYTFVQKSMTGHFGFMVGWAIFMDYLFSPLIAALATGIFVSAFLPFIPTSVIIIFFILFMTVINVLGIKITVNFNIFSVAIQVLTIFIFIILSIRSVLAGTGTGTLISSVPFFNPEVNFTLVLAGVPLLIFAFLGFDAVTTLAEETVNPKKNLPRAIFIILLSAGALFVVLSYFIQLVHPDYTTFQDPDSAAIEIAIMIGGNLFTSIFLAIMILAYFSAASAHTASGSRVLFAMGRDNIIPERVFGYLSPRFKTPVFNILLIGVFSLIALVIDIETATSFVSYGALVAFTFVNLSVIFHYFIKEKQRNGKGVMLYLVLPFIGAFLTAFMWFQLDGRSLILGTIWIVLGIIYLAYITKGFNQPPPEIELDSKEEEIV